MKIKYIYFLIVLLLCISCRKAELGWKLPRMRAMVTTEFASDVSSYRFTARGISDEGKAGGIRERGFCYSTLDNPTLEKANKVTAPLGTGEYKVEITGLTPETEYYFRAYAINAHGTWYGEVKKQKTFFGTWPKVRTVSAVLENPMQVRVAGEVTDYGGYTTTRGVCYGTSPIPDTAVNKISCGIGMGFYDTLLTMPIPGDWYFRTFAVNSKGVAYGEIVKVVVQSSTTPVPPTVVTDSAVIGVANTLIGYGSIVANGGSPVTATGFCYSSSPNPDLTTGQVETNLTVFTKFSALLLGVTPGTTYYVRAFATNAIGTGYGADAVVTIP
jgi:hypothetical protein